ncbi:MAG: alternative ribosome rescue aminoacyl-tRNA hydrolase ArfB [bacterium]
MSVQHPFPDDALEFRFVQASGPGGQHVNKTSTAVELRVNVCALGLRPSVARRLSQQQRGKLNKQGELIIQADTFRSQLKNRKDALSRLEQMVRDASVVPKKRIPTKPTLNAKRKRLDTKKQRGQTKSQRRKPSFDA